MWTEDYSEQNRLMHKNNPKRFGIKGWKKADYFLREVYPTMPVLRGAWNCLDYGCGKGTFIEHMEKQLGTFFEGKNYDPFVEEFSKRPNEQFHLVVCTDVLEHIEPEYLASVLDDIFQYSEKYVFIILDTLPDQTKKLPDGTNPHRIVQTAAWWRDKLLPYSKDLQEFKNPSGKRYYTCLIEKA